MYHTGSLFFVVVTVFLVVVLVVVFVVVLVVLFVVDVVVDLVVVVVVVVELPNFLKNNIITYKFVSSFFGNRCIIQYTIMYIINI